jgi:hypothetical protein
MDLTKEELAYSQQKNRVHIYNQAKRERLEMYGFPSWSSLESSDEAWIDYRYMQLCEQANITPW